MGALDQRESADKNPHKAGNLKIIPEYLHFNLQISGKYTKKFKEKKAAL